jgi:hypothetical protein
MKTRLMFFALSASVLFASSGGVVVKLATRGFSWSDGS